MLRRSRPVLSLAAPAAVFALGLLASAAAKAGEVAVVDVDGVGLLPGSLNAVNASLRAAVASREPVQDPAQTAGFVKDAVAAGMSCSLADDRCALQVGIAAGVDAVIVGQIIAFDDRWVLELRRVADGAPTKRAAGVLSPNPASVGEVVARLAGGAPPSEMRLPLRVATTPAAAELFVDGAPVDPVDVKKGVLWVTPGPHEIRAEAPARRPGSAEVVIAADALPPPLALALPELSSTTTAPLWAVASTSAGAGLLVVGVSGVFASEAALAGPMRPGAREVYEGLGQAGLVVAFVGVVGVGAGVAGLVLSE